MRPFSSVLAATKTFQMHNVQNEHRIDRFTRFHACEECIRPNFITLFTLRIYMYSIHLCSINELLVSYIFLLNINYLVETFEIQLQRVY